MKYLTLEETKKIASGDMRPDGMLKIREDSIKDFKWGSVFGFESANYAKTGNITGLPFLLVDKITGFVTPIDYQKNLDSQLEKYREEKGYEHVIKFKAIVTLIKCQLLKG